MRFAEGKGVAPNFDEAAKWYDRAAQAGVVPAIFRLGTLYEKGLGVKKDVDIARRYYMQAAERGNAKAMHNLAVLDADGGGKGANYKSASQWFRKAADRGVADSQFNLGILYARGIGVEQNLAESFKWFSLAAAQGDADSVRKRDDIAKRLDPQSLAAAKLAIQTFTAGTPARRRHQRGDPGRRMGLGAGAGQRGKARGQAGFDQARRPLILNYSPRRKLRGRRLRKSRLLADSLVPPGGDFGYAGARRSIRVPRVFRIRSRNLCRERFRPASGLNPKASARAALPPDRRHSGQCFPHPGDGRGGGFRVRHVRHRRRIPDDAAVDLRRHRARGRGRLRRQPHRGLVVFRRAVLLAPPRHRSGAGAGAAVRRHRRHRARRLDLHAAALARPARPDDRAVLRGAADHRRRTDVLGRAARDPAGAARRRRYRCAAPAAMAGSTACR